MCLHTRQTKPLVATKDIKVFKTLDVESVLGKVPTGLIQGTDGNIYRPGYPIRLVSTQKRFPYKIGKTYKTRLILKYGNIEAGFHSFNYKSAKVVRKYDNSGVLVECIIPKGSLYYIGTNNGTSKGIASNKIKITKILNN